MKIWFYYAKAGGGHKAVASALARAVKQLNVGELQTREIDLAERTDILFNFFIEKVYIFLTHYAEWAYWLLYELNERRPIITFEYFLADLLLKRSLKARLVADKPDAIIATFYMVSPLKAAMKELGLSIPIMMVVTEPFSAPPVWFYYPDLKFILFSDMAEKCALSSGVPKENVFKFPQITNHEVLQLTETDKGELKKKMGLDPTKKTILIIGGANGLPKSKIVLRDMLRSEMDAQYIVVCGDNKTYQNQIKKMVNGDPKVVVFGFVNNISELIAIADLVITKAGAGVTAESLLNKKPMLITYYIYGQEEGTKDYVVNNELGWYEPKPDRAVERVRKFFSVPEIAIDIQRRFEAMQLKSGNEEVARFIVREIESNS